MIKLENTKYNTMFDETKPITIFNLPCDIIEDTMINIIYYEIDERCADEGYRDHYYEIRFSSAKDDECWIGECEETYTLKSAVQVWKEMRQELIDERDKKENQKYLTNRMLPLLRRE